MRGLEKNCIRWRTQTRRHTTDGHRDLETESANSVKIRFSMCNLLGYWVLGFPQTGILISIWHSPDQSGRNLILLWWSPDQSGRCLISIWQMPDQSGSCLILLWWLPDFNLAVAWSIRQLPDIFFYFFLQANQANLPSLINAAQATQANLPARSILLRQTRQSGKWRKFLRSLQNILMLKWTQTVWWVLKNQ